MDSENTSSMHKRSMSPSPDDRVHKRTKQSVEQASSSGEEGGFGSLLLGHEELFEHSPMDLGHGVALTLADGSSFYASAHAQAMDPNHSLHQHRGVVLDPGLHGAQPQAHDVMMAHPHHHHHPHHHPVQNVINAADPSGAPLEFVIDESLLLQPDITFGGIETSSVGLDIPPAIPDDEFARRIAAMRAELARQASLLPLLPESRVCALPPKPDPPAYHPVPKDASPEERERLTELNNDLALREQTLDKMRNNQAAKKSRQTRVEALEDTTAMLHESVVEARWLRLKVLALGGDLGDWDAVPGGVREGLAGEIAARVRDVKEAADREKKRVERERRTLDNRQRKRRQAEAGASGGAAAAAAAEEEERPSRTASVAVKREGSVEEEEEEARAGDAGKESQYDNDNDNSNEYA